MENQYLDLLMDVLEVGDDRMDRTGVGTRALFGRQLRCHLKDGFPAITTKKLAWKAVVGELLWFLEGSRDNARLAQLTHGDPEKPTIWTGNAEADYWKPKARFKGDVGRIYGVQWRRWVGAKLIDFEDAVYHHDAVDTTTYLDAKVQFWKIDQIANIVNSLVNNPTDRRMVLSAYNVGELNQMSLPPCHMFSQFFVNQRKNEVSCQVYIRSNDLFLGLPFNIASYALLTHLLAQVSGREVGELIVTIGDAHIYKNHFDAVKEQVLRQPLQAPKLVLNPDVKDIDLFTPEDIVLANYQSHPAIKAEMAV